MKKLWLLTILVLLQLYINVVAVQAQIVNDRKITYVAEGISLKEAFQQLEKLSGFSINYSNTLLNDKRIIRIGKGERSVKEVLELLLNGTAFTFKQSGSQNILILAKPQIKGKLTGKVTDESGQPLPGASVRIPAADASAQCREDGSYTLNVVPGIYTVEASFISFETLRQENVAIKSGVPAVLDLSMKSSSNDLNEVIVTALDIKREEKSLGYAVTKIDSNQLTDAVSNNWTDALSGKVAGLNLVRSNGGPAGSNKIILRGENNLTGDNEALIVVDGVVINNSGGRRTSNASDAVYGTGSDNMPADYGSSVNDINPEDIESVTVLKGPGAAALYGQRGANGAIIITTKSGNAKKKRLGIKFTSNGSVESPNRWPDLQYEYGQGLDGAAYYSYGASSDGASTSGTSSAYGPRFDGQMFYQYDPVTQTQGAVRTPWVPYKNQIRDFFQTGTNLTNSLTLDGAYKNTSARLSVTNQNNTWIVPETGMERTSIALSVNSKITPKLNISAKANYNNRYSDNLPGNGYGNQSLMYWYIFWQPSADINWLKNYWVNGSENKLIKYPFSSFPENPYAISNEFINRTGRNGLTGNVQASYQFTKELSLQLRSSLDLASENRAQERPYDAGSRLPTGSYREQKIYREETNIDS